MIPRWLLRLIKQNPAVAPRDDEPAQVAEAERAAVLASAQRARVEAREPTVLALARELRTRREENHLAGRLERLWQEGRRA